jgi:hypothetical protein
MKEKNKLKQFKLFFLLMIWIWINPVFSEEVPVGYVLSQANLGSAKNQTFEGHNLDAMLTPGLREMLKNGLKITLSPYKPMVYGKKVQEATTKYSGNVKLDRATRTISGYVAGTPFPNLSEKDPDVALKMVWNLFYNNIQLPDVIMASTIGYSVDGVKGVERSYGLVNSQLKVKNRSSLSPQTVGDGTIYRKVLLFNIFPQDIAGTGVYLQRYSDGRVDDSWAYIKSLRRIRRMSGGTWMDPVPGSDFVNDDSGGLDSYPTWYKDYVFVGKQRILAVVHGYTVTANRPPETLFDLKHAPYWNPIQLWEPREVLVFDAIAPDEHPYSKKRIYFDPEGNTPLEAEAYDKKGALWKFIQLPLAEVVQPDGSPSMAGPYFLAVDFQRMHASALPIPYNRQNDPNTDPDDWSPESLSRPEKFSIPSLIKRYGPATFVPN